MDSVLTVTRVQRYLYGNPLGFTGSSLPLKYRVKGSKQNIGFILRALYVKVKCCKLISSKPAIEKPLCKILREVTYLAIIALDKFISQENIKLLYNCTLNTSLSGNTERKAE